MGYHKNWREIHRTDEIEGGGFNQFGSVEMKNLSEKESEIREKLKDHEERITKLEKLLEKRPEEVKRKLSIREFMLSKSPKTEKQKTLAIAYYLEKCDNLTSFNAKDLEGGFRRAKEKIPRNVNYEVIKNIQKGHVMEAEDKKDKRKAWCLTSSGEKYVDNNFEQEK